MTSVYALAINEPRIGATIGSRNRAPVIHQNAHSDSLCKLEDHSLVNSA